MEKKQKEKCVLYLGSYGFPYGMAEVQKIFLVSKSLACEGITVYVVNSRGVHSRGRYPQLKKCGRYNGIIYLYTSLTQYRDEEFIKRNIKKTFERILEFIAISKIYRKRNVIAALVNAKSIWRLLFYKAVASFYGIKLILNYAEYISSMPNRKKLTNRINDFIFDKYAMKLCDGIIPISEFLIEKIKERAPDKKYLKIPILVDPDRFNHNSEIKRSNYFLFCGGAGYWEIVQFIIRAFEKVKCDNIFLLMIVNGDNNQIEKIDDIIENSLKNLFIKRLTNLSNNEVTRLFQKAIGLLIPLRFTLQDKARFPHKIGEYLASGAPVITTNWGEIPYYLKNNFNAFITDNYDIDEFADKMKYLIDHPDKGIEIGKNGKKLAFEEFNYKNHGRKIIEFIDSLN